MIMPVAEGKVYKTDSQNCNSHCTHIWELSLYIDVHDICSPVGGEIRVMGSE